MPRAVRPNLPNDLGAGREKTLSVYPVYSFQTASNPPIAEGKSLAVSGLHLPPDQWEARVSSVPGACGWGPASPGRPAVLDDGLGVKTSGCAVIHRPTDPRSPLPSGLFSSLLRAGVEGTQGSLKPV